MDGIMDREVVYYDTKHKRERIVYHGGCLDCVSQFELPLEICDGCQYKEPNWNLPDLSYQRLLSNKHKKTIDKNL